jgi:ABC-type spermidine/putrescine transport system permease subunit I
MLSTRPARRPSLATRVRRRSQEDKRSSWKPRWLWAAASLPGGLTLILLFVVPFYVMLAVAAGQLNPIFETPVPVWNPLMWSWANFSAIWHDLVGPASLIDPPFVRTILYTAAASAISLAIGYPIAYFVTRYAGRRKTFFLVLLISPFWVSYMMRMLAWIDILQVGGYANRILEDLHLMSRSNPFNWLGGEPVTVILGLVYGYIPYLIVVLYAGLDRIDARLLEAARDLGLGRWRTFWRVTIPLSRQTILAGMFITVLPMLGDYFTNQLLSATPGTTMIGNVIEGQLEVSTLQGEGAALALGLLVILLAPMFYYVWSTGRASRQNV